VAGERSNACLLYLSITSRLLERPVNVLVTGPSSAGKSFLVERVASLFPPEATYKLTASSPLALLYSKEDFAHRMVIISEAAGLQHDGIGASIIRSIAWDGRVVYDTVEKTSDGLKPVRIEKPGPTGLITTTRSAVEPELETRMLTLSIRDDPAHSRAILGATARQAAGKLTSFHLAPFHSFQRYLALSDVREALVPFDETLAELVDAHAVRVRRDFQQLLMLIKAHALLCQHKREKGVGGQVVATLDDYKVIHKLTAELFKATATDELTSAQREAVKAVIELNQPSGKTLKEKVIHGIALAEKEGVTVQQVAKHLGIDRSAALRRLTNPLKRGYIVNMEHKKGRPLCLVPGDPLPEDRPALPSPEEVEHATKQA
jgi:hypothetical protein